MNQGKRIKKSHPRTIALLGFEGAAVLDLTGRHEVFSVASYLTRDKAAPPYRLMLLSDQASPFRTTSGLSLIADAAWHDSHEKVDTLICG